VLRFVVDLPTAESVANEWRSHLSAGGAYVRGAQGDHDAPCVLVLRGPGGRELELSGRVTVNPCERDGGHALRDYERRGFRVVREALEPRGRSAT
jgi:hypothetical protein